MIRASLISHTINPEQVVAWAAKTCYSNDNVHEIDPLKDLPKFLNKLRDIGHMSPFEHANFTFAIDGISRACSHQLVRHRIASYSQRSQRYVTDDADWVIPKSIQESDLYPDFLVSLQNAVSLYNELVDSGIPKEDARFILPNACDTQLIMTMNARELIHFCQIRLCNRAQWEIRELATLIAGALIKNAPLLFKGLVAPLCLVLGQCPEGEMRCNSRVPDEIQGFM